MTDNPKINVPVFLVLVSREELLAMQSLLARVKESVSAIESETGKLLTAGNRTRDEAMVSFGHDVLALLFSFPVGYRSLNAFFNKAALPELYEVKGGDSANIYEFFSRLDYATRVPADKTLRGKLYPARWDSRENIPCLLHKVQATIEQTPDYRAGLDGIAAASTLLNATCREALEAWSPCLAAVRAKNKEWRETTPEGKAYDEAFRKRIEGILGK